MTEENQQQQKPEVSWGCAITSFIFGMMILIPILWASGVFDSDTYDNDDDCNTSFIESDYNGDGEEDAEDYRIQTSGC